MEAVFGGIEGGGTKFVCVLGTGPEQIVDELRLPTTTPEETLGRVIDFFQQPRPNLRLMALGLASFGPIDPDPTSHTYGHILDTPKAHWPNIDAVGILRAALGVPIGFDTDVNGAALGEARWGAGQHADPLVYVTVGTGIGGGALVGGHPIHGLQHPEMGHLLVPNFGGDTFAGICPFHGRCLEGVACGPAIAARIGRPADQLAEDDPVWDLEAQYLAYGLLSITEVLSPQRIIVGGGVASQGHLFPAIRRHLRRLNNGYISRAALAGGIDEYVVPPGLGGRSGVMGGLELARRALQTP